MSQQEQLKASSEISEKRTRAGKKTYTRIVECAYNILLNESLERCTMQGIAKRLDIRLSNVQYYFSNRDKLIRAVLEHSNQVYHKQWDKLYKETEKCPKWRFRAFIELNLNDVRSAQTRHFFIQLWGLLSTADNYSGKLLKEMYEPYVAKFIDLLLDLVPNIPAQEARIRSEIIVSMLEGLMVTTIASSDSAEHPKKRNDAVIAAAFDIATQPSE